MNKIILSILISLLATCNLYSQTYLGFKGGLNISSLSTSQAKSRPGFHAGVLMNIPISESEKWFFQPGLEFTMNGEKAADKYNPDFSSYIYSLETPLSLSYRVGDEDVNLGFDMGVYLRYALSGNYWTDSEDGRIKPDAFDKQKRFDVGPQLGFSVIVYNIYMGCSVQYGLIKPWDIYRGNRYGYRMSFGYMFQL